MSVITLSNEHFEVKVNPALGGSVLAFNWLTHPKGKVPILRDASNAESVLEASNFPLVPFSNRIKNARFNWQGEEYQIPQNFLPETSAIHGQGWQGAWNVIEQSDTFLIIEFVGNEDWPFSYNAKQVFELTDKGLTHQMQITNTGDSEMPAGLGFHPYFVRTPQASFSAGVDKMWAVDDQCLPTKLVDVPMALNSQQVLANDIVLDNGFSGFTGQATVLLPEYATQIAIEANEYCKFAVIFTPEGEDFFCIEPVTHCTDAINMHAQGAEDTGVQALAANESLKISMKLIPSKY